MESKDTKMSAQVCLDCHEIIPADELIQMNDCCFHDECFVCDQCEEELQTNSAHVSNNGKFCSIHSPPISKSEDKSKNQSQKTT